MTALVSPSLVATGQTTEPFKAERIERTASFLVKAPVEKAFPLFGPVREMEWCTGWEPQVIYTTDPYVEEHMVFQSQPRFDNEPPYLWLITQFQPEAHFVEYTVSTNERVWFISVKCAPEGGHTKVTVRYRFTGLTPRGNALNRLALESMYANNLQDWEDEIDRYLQAHPQAVK